MKNLLTGVFILLIIAVGNLTAQPNYQFQKKNRTQLSAVNQLATPTAQCKENFQLSLKKGVVANPNHTKSRKARTQVINGQFHIWANAKMAENDFQWAKFSFTPGYPNAKITGVSVRYTTKANGRNSPKGVYISQTRMIKGPNANRGTVKIDDPKNLYRGGSHTASGTFECGTDTKTVMLKLVMNQGDKIIIHGIVVHFDCVPPIIIDYLCPPNLPNPKIHLAGKEVYQTGGGTFVRYRIPVLNYNQYPDYLFSPDAFLPPCGANNNSSRTWVDIFDEHNNRIYGFCALGKSVNLKSIWFSVKKGEQPPKRVRIVMKDRGCQQEYASNWISIR